MLTTATCASMDFCNQFLVAALVVLGLLPVACEAQTDFSVTTGALSTWNETEWSLESTKLVPGQYQSRLSLANGYVGASLAQIGPFFERDVNQTNNKTGSIPINGWPLFDERISFSTISGFFNVQQNTTGNNYPWINQYGWDSFIAGIPHSTALIYAFGDQYLDATVSNTTISNFSSKLSFKTGVAEWAYTWTPANTAASFNITYSAIFSRQRPNVIAVKSTIVPSADVKGTVTDLLDGRSAARSYLDTKGIDQNGPTIYSIFHPTNLPQVTGAVVSGVNFSNGYTDISSRTTAQGAYVSGNETTIGQSFSISLKAGQTATFFKYVGVASSDKFSNPESTARQQQAQAATSGWDTLLSEHVAAWAALLTEDSTDNFADPITGELPDDQLIEILHVSSVANPYFLLQNMQPQGSGLNDDGISVGGLVSDSYSGQVFWDMDYWMAPGLNLAFPDWAKQITNFRVKQHPQALANAAFNNYPNGSALYSWTAGRYGNCTGTGPCVDYQYHLNYDIVFNMQQLKAVTGNNSWFEGGPQDVFNSAVLMTSHLLEYNETTQTYWIHNMTDPDEYANMIDNGAFTLASATDLLQQANSQLTTQGQSINQTWEAQQNVEFPKADSGITLEFTGMNNSAAVKQADVVLLAYPLDYLQNYSTSEKLLDLDYYANRQSPNGPAMTYSVFAVIANALSPSGCSAFTYTLGGTLSYLRGPWYQFSEQAVDDASINGGTNPAFPFLTGHGGANQIVPFGFLGIRTDQPVLYINPSLPPQIPQVRVRTIHYAGATLSFFINQTHTTITRFVTPQSKGLVDAYANTPFPFKLGTPSTSSTDAVSYTITTNQTITVPNRLYWKTLTNAGNLIQCLPVSSTDSYAAGQFPVAANDGASSTDWQPASNESASIIINMTTVSPSPISGIFIDWAARPPLRATVYLGNSTETTDQGTFLFGNEAVISLGNIAASLPYNATAAAESLDEVVPVVGNTTSIDVTGAWSGNYARLVIEGCLENDSNGATVAEFVLIGANSPNSSSTVSAISTVSSATATVAAESTSVALSNATPSATGTATGSAATSTRRSAASREVKSGDFKLLAVMLVGVLIGMI